MARKKKSKKADPEKKVGAEASASAAQERGAAAEPAAETQSAKDEASPAPKRRAAKKKRTRKKAAKKERAKKERAKKERAKKETAEPQAEVSEPEEPPVDLDADLGSDAVMLAEMAAGEQAATAVEPHDDAPLPLEDIDAILDDEDSDDLHSLIALTVAGAEPDEPAEAEPAESLDDAPVDEAIAAGDDAPVVDDEEIPEDEIPEKEEEIDLTGAIDLGPEITPELRDRLLAQALAHVELQDARYRVPYTDVRPSGRWKAAVAALLLLVAAVVAATPPGWVLPEPPARLDDAARTRDLRAALLLQAQQIDAYRVRYQRLPRSLDELPQRISGIRYVSSGNRAYQLVGYERDGDPIIYDSSNPAAEFTRLIPRLITEDQQ